eukprot:gene11579-17836_t
MWGAATKHITTVDAHCGGEPARIVTSGLPTIPGKTMMEKRAYCMEHLDHYRKVLLQEPRGSPCQNADYIVPACCDEAVFGVIIAEQGKVYPAMSGHNIICVATVLIETGMVPASSSAECSFKLDTPAGLVTIVAATAAGKAERVTIHNVESWCEKRSVRVPLPPRHLPRIYQQLPFLRGGEGGRGAVTAVEVDISYGGMWYVIVDVAQFSGDGGVNPAQLSPSNGKLLCKLGEVLKQCAKEASPVTHPHIDYPGPDILAFVDKRHDQNAVIMSNQTFSWDDDSTWSSIIDRSPCGTGTCAVMASKFARGELSAGSTFVHKSIILSEFEGAVLST